MVSRNLLALLCHPTTRVGVPLCSDLTLSFSPPRPLWTDSSVFPVLCLPVCRLLPPSDPVCELGSHLNVTWSMSHKDTDSAFAECDTFAFPSLQTCLSRGCYLRDRSLTQPPKLAPGRHSPHPLPNLSLQVLVVNTRGICLSPITPLDQATLLGKLKMPIFRNPGVRFSWLRSLPSPPPMWDLLSTLQSDWGSDRAPRLALW